MIRYIILDSIIVLSCVALALLAGASASTLGVGFLEANGLGAHVPPSGPLFEEYVTQRSVAALLCAFPVILGTCAVFILLGSRARLSLWNPNRPWNQTAS